MGHKQRNPVVQSFIYVRIKLQKVCMFHNKAKLKEPSLSELSDNLIYISRVVYFNYKSKLSSILLSYE